MRGRAGYLAACRPCHNLSRHLLSQYRTGCRIYDSKGCFKGARSYINKHPRGLQRLVLDSLLVEVIVFYLLIIKKQKNLCLSAEERFACYISAFKSFSATHHTCHIIIPSYHPRSSHRIYPRPKPSVLGMPNEGSRVECPNAPPAIDPPVYPSVIYLYVGVCS